VPCCRVLQGWKTSDGLKKKHFRFFLYEDRTRKYDPKAHEKHPIHGTPKDKSPVSEGEEHHVKNEDEIDESQKQGWI